MTLCCYDVLSVALDLGQFVLSTEHCPSAHHQTEGDPSSRVEPIPEGSESHPYPGPPSGNSVCPAPLQAIGTGFLWNIRLHHAHTNALPGETTVRLSESRSASVVVVWLVTVSSVPAHCLQPPVVLTRTVYCTSWNSTTSLNFLIGLDTCLMIFIAFSKKHPHEPQTRLCLCYSSGKNSRKEGINYLSWNGLKSDVGEVLSDNPVLSCHWQWMLSVLSNKLDQLHLFIWPLSFSTARQDIIYKQLTVHV